MKKKTNIKIEIKGGEKRKPTAIYRQFIRWQYRR